MAVLFVCLGNICRSPTAEAAFRRACPGIACDSAGTGDWHVGDAPYGPMQAAARARGLMMSDLRARQLTRADFGRFALILGMDADNLARIEALRPPESAARTGLLTDYGSLGHDAVPDPYYTRRFEETLEIVEDAVAGLVRALQRG